MRQSLTSRRSSPILLKRCLSLIASAFLAATLTGCLGSGAKVKVAPVTIKVGEVPADIQTCFDSLVQGPRKGPMSKKQALALIAALKLSELEKSQCGKRLLRWVRQFQ